MMAWLRRYIFIGAGGALVIIALFLFTLEMVNAGRVISGVRAGALDISRLGPTEAKEKIDQVALELRATPLTVRIADSNALFSATPDELGVRFETSAMSEQAYALGRRKSFLAGIGEQVAALFKPRIISAIVQFDEPTFAERVAAFASQVETAPQAADLSYDSKKQHFTAVSGKNGKRIDRIELKTLIITRLTPFRPQQQEIIISLKEDPPPVSDAAVRAILSDAQEVLEAAPFTLTLNRQQWFIDQDLIASWLTAEPMLVGRPDTARLTLHRERVDEFFLRDLVPVINREPRNAEFTIKGDRVVAFSLAQDGQKLEFDATYQAMVAAFVRDIKKTAAAHVALAQPQITDESAAGLGIRTLLAAGESDFSGSPKNRIHNIKVGAARYHGLLIKPGEEFSFNALLGAVGPEQGYLPELVIKQNKTVPEYGGGLCQVATTTFRAAVLSGLDITKRYPHSYPVRYYGTPGFDATIYPPNPDLRFVNDTPGHILVQTKIVGTKLYFEFYGTDDGREVKIIGPDVYDKKRDGSAKATLVQQILYNGELAREEVFKSSYRSPALYPVQKRNPLE